MGKPLFPRADMAFWTMSRRVTQSIALDPARFAISADDAATLSAAYERFDAALMVAKRGGSREATREKDRTRAEAEKQIRRVVLLLRAAGDAGVDALCRLGVADGRAKRERQSCPQEPPRLRFVRAIHLGGSAPPVHELSFAGQGYSKSKPAGAARLELFVDLIPLDEPIPAQPGANLGRPWYLRSFTRSPIKIVPPLTRVPMRVVYWGRWADSTGNVGPFSPTATGWVEGGELYLPGPARPGVQPPKLLSDTTDIKDREAIYRVALIEAQIQSMRGVQENLPPPSEPRQMEDQRAA